ncbi:TerD family protein [Deinococcus roseus]|uniref:Chemical-damaging agent resistance protein C n=1 Tax=Deinococcus roseus TaxID=392414 RepID=A0ABQ2D0L9_9DEIO|nr:TerD family protein [Deinococcus roseus]GGJ39289.1 chemical-damaging agent resistance protein C [Deinococcus roseus]
MPVSLSKGGNVSLTKEAPGLTSITVGLGWDIRTTDGAAFDLDASAFLIGESGKVASDSDFVFFNNSKSADGSVEYGGDNRTGEGAGDDETIKIDLNAVPQNVTRIVIAVTIYDSEARRQNFGMVRNAYARVLNNAGGAEIARYDLSEDASTETAMIFAEVYRNNAEWKFKAIGQGYNNGLRGLAVDFGVNVG